MNTKSKMMIALVAGVALGAAAVQGLYAQAKPKAFFISESEALDPAAIAEYGSQIRAAIDAAGGKRLNTPGGKVVGFVGNPPKRIAISEWESLEKLETFQNSEAYKKLIPQRDKAVKTIRSYAVEAN